MLKLLLLMLGIWIVLTIFRQRGRPPAAPPKPANMVRCALCGVHLPESESIASEGLYYCCEAHFLEHKKA